MHVVPALSLVGVVSVLRSVHVDSSSCPHASLCSSCPQVDMCSSCLGLLFVCSSYPQVSVCSSCFRVAACSSCSQFPWGCLADSSFSAVIKTNLASIHICRNWVSQSVTSVKTASLTHQVSRETQPGGRLEDRGAAPRPGPMAGAPEPATLSVKYQ